MHSQCLEVILLAGRFRQHRPPPGFNRAGWIGEILHIGSPALFPRSIGPAQRILDHGGRDIAFRTTVIGDALIKSFDRGFGGIGVVLGAGDLENVAKCVERDIKRFFDLNQIAVVMPVEIGKEIIILKLDFNSVAFFLTRARPISPREKYRQAS